MVRTKKAKILAIICTLGMLATMFIVPFTASAATAMGVSYNVHGQSYGTQAVKSNGELAGTVGASKRVEAIAVALTNPVSAAAVSYQVYQGKAWTTPVSSGFAGVTGKSLMDQKFRLTLSGAPGYALEYRVQGQSYGWTAWATVQNGTALASAPSLGTLGKRIEAVEIKVVAVAMPSTAASVSAINSTIPVGGQTGFTFKDASGAVVTPTGVTWAVADATTGSVSASGIFTAAKAGPASITATIGTTVLTATVDVAGQVAGVKVSAASASLIANGLTTDVITVNAVDAYGYVVSSYNGTAHLALSSNTMNEANFGGAVATSPDVTITNGVGTVTMTVGNTAGTDTIVSSLLTASTGSSQSASITYGTLAFTTTSPSATQLVLSAASTALSTNSSANSDAVTIKVEDASNNVYNTTAYVNLTITGPGSFASGGTAVTTESLYVMGSTSVPVYAVTGMNGTITVSAASGTLASGTVSFAAVQTTAPAKLAITSAQGSLTSGAQGLPNGTAFTTYTVQLEDANGNPVAPTTGDALTISDNVTTLGVGGTLEYYTPASSGQPNSSPIGSSASAITSQSLPTTSGNFSFIVLNTTTGTTNPTISVKDTLLAATVTAPYTYESTAASQIALVGLNSAVEATTSVKLGQSITYTVQLEDVSGNAISSANQAVKFYLTGNTAILATIGSISTWSSNNAYTVVTDSTGKASVTVSIPSTDSPTVLGTAVTVYAVYGSSTLTVATTVRGLTAYTTSLALATTAGDTVAVTPTLSINANNSAVLSGAYADQLDGDGSVITTPVDKLQVSSSNYSVLTVNGTTSSDTFNANLAVPVIAAKAPGTATITISDLTNPTVPALTYTFTVGAGSAVSVVGINPDATTGAYTCPTAGVSSAFTLNMEDAGGNVVGATYPTTLTENQVDEALGFADNTSIRLASGSTDVTSVTFTQGQPSIQVFVDGVTASEVTGEKTPLILATDPPIITALSVSGSTVTLTVNNPVSTAVIAATLGSYFEVNATAASTATVVGNTITLTMASAPGAIVLNDVTYIDGGSNSIITGYGEALANII